MKYDAIVIGAGQAGPSLAAFLAYAGQKVAIVEGGKIGGSCVNYGCTPTKTMRASARIAYQAKRAAEYGIQTGDVQIDFQAVMKRTMGIVANSRDGLSGWLESVENLDVYRAYGEFAGTDDGLHQVKVGDDSLESEKVYLNVGTRASAPPIDGLSDVAFLDNVNIWDLDALPEHLLIIGGGYIGIELGQIFCRFGSKVSIVEFMPRVAIREDEDVSAEIERILGNEGVKFYTNHAAKKVQNLADGQVSLLLEDRETGESHELQGSHVMVAAGRKPNTDSLNLQAVGLETDRRGFIQTNEKLETAVAGIYALGDINGRGAFTHTSYHDFQIVYDNWKGADRSADDRIMAYSMFTDPPMGRVGMSEHEARESGRNILTMTHYAKDVSRAKEDGETNGLVKIVVDADTEQILGACTFIMQGDDVIQVVSNFMATGASYKVMQHALPVHPTISEFFPTWLSKLAPVED
ncbi:MAG: mercuric reductase [Anaerolineae bacterium]|nr:mercuric reductase [Anaerolineae bacterium]